MSLQTIRDPLLTELGLDKDSSLVQDVKARLLNFINQTIDKINDAGKWDFLKTLGSITTVDATDIYSLPSDCELSKIVNNKFYIISQQKELVKRTDQYMVEKLLIADTGLPDDWRPYGKDSSNNDQIQVYPKVNATYVGLTINFDYSKNVALLVNESDTTPFNEAIVRAGALARYLKYDEDDSGASYWQGEFNAGLQKALAQNRGAKQFTPRFK